MRNPSCFKLIIDHDVCVHNWSIHFFIDKQIHIFDKEKQHLQNKATELNLFLLEFMMISLLFTIVLLYEP